MAVKADYRDDVFDHWHWENTASGVYYHVRNWIGRSIPCVSESEFNAVWRLYDEFLQKHAQEPHDLKDAADAVTLEEAIRDIEDD